MKEEKSTFWTCFTVIVGVATVIAAVFAGLTYFDIKIPLSKESSVENGIIVDKQEQTSKLEDKKTEDDIVDVDPLFVNLGLSVKWSIRNIGALLPEEFGDYYAWGETEPKTEYTWSNYKWCKGFDAPPIKYGLKDKKIILDSEDDLSQRYGWRMPTAKEMEELLTRCVWTWTTLKGIKGYKVKGPNGNSIFLPAAGFRHNGVTQFAGEYGRYWSSSLYQKLPQAAYYLSFTSEDDINLSFNERFYGHTVRPVKP